MRKSLLLVTAVALFIAGSAIGGSAIAGAAASSASAANGVSASDDATTAVHRNGRGHRGPRGRRGRRGARGPRGFRGAPGPPGPVGSPGATGGGGTGGSAGVVPTEFRGNSGAPTTLVFSANGMTIETDCSSLNVARLRSQQENGFAAATFVALNPIDNGGGAPDSDNIASDHFLKSDASDFDNNNAVALSFIESGTDPAETPGSAGDGGIYQGHFAYSGGQGQVVTGVYITSINRATAQGNCVYAGTANRD